MSFALLGSSRVKALRKMLLKLTQGEFLFLHQTQEKMSGSALSV
jgi:hypothetical protein